MRQAGEKRRDAEDGALVHGHAALFLSSMALLVAVGALAFALAGPAILRGYGERLYNSLLYAFGCF